MQELFLLSDAQAKTFLVCPPGSEAWKYGLGNSRHREGGANEVLETPRVPRGA